MIKQFRERVAGLFRPGDAPPPITENSSLHEIALQYPQLHEFVERKYGLKVDIEDNPLSLREFVERHGLPPAQIVFMEVQMSRQLRGVQRISAKAAREFLEQHPRPRILDVREDWELEICTLPGSEALRPELLDEMLTEWPKETPLLLYCHFGIRSLDAAYFLADRGFTTAATIEGGIEAWSLEIDPSVPRYESAIC